MFKSEKRAVNLYLYLRVILKSDLKAPRSSVSIQSHCRVPLFVTPWTAARQTSLSITNSRSLLKLMSSKPYAKLNSKDLNAIAKIIKLLQENIGMNLGDLGLVVLS